MVSIDVEANPVTEEKAKHYSDQYKCWPLPLFIITTTFLQVVIYFFYSMDIVGLDSMIISPLIYQPENRLDLWRFISYASLHAGWIHLAFNTLVQVLVGIPLEMVHGSIRIGCLYLAGVVAGSLGTSVFNSDVYLVGASGGVYALLAAHLANVLINYNTMQFACVRLFGIAFVATTDMSFAVYEYFSSEMIGLPVSYIAHLTGALAGLTLGLVILKYFGKQPHEELVWWIALGGFTSCLVFAIIYNLLHPYPYVGIWQQTHIVRTY
ncbi:unnamed protein product [Meganyctiphanes norvegica]|uniref:rhomboid protease n=1 Tax=Meganyctiphanes norvegica TaxID=48144 RepID=A0AAV2Q3B2_MEGNR